MGRTLVNEEGVRAMGCNSLAQELPEASSSDFGSMGQVLLLSTGGADPQGEGLVEDLRYQLYLGR